MRTSLRYPATDPTVLCSTDPTARDSRERLDMSTRGRAVGPVSLDSYIALYTSMGDSSLI